MLDVCYLLLPAFWRIKMNITAIGADVFFLAFRSRYRGYTTQRPNIVSIFIQSRLVENISVLNCQLFDFKSYETNSHKPDSIVYRRFIKFMKYILVLIYIF